MAGELLRQKQMPWCTLFLVLGTIACHICVLIGNLSTARAMEGLGSSTGGWSQVGLGVSHSLQVELDESMVNVSQMLLDGLGHIEFVQDAMDTVLSLAGNETDSAITNSPELALLQRDPKKLMQLQLQSGKPSNDAAEGEASGNVIAAITPVIMSAVHKVLVQVMDKVSELLDKLLTLIRPALLKIADWMVRFGDQIQSGIETFSVTLDRVQKIFDQVMAQLSGKGDNEAELLDEAFSLFNTDGSGEIDANDLRSVAGIYHITAFEGNLSDELVDKYDTSGNGEIGMDELQHLVNDPAIPNALSVVLRTFARQMSEIGGNVAAARMRDEVAYAVSKYFGLVCAKNMTRVTWVADALGNGSLPLQFTADVLVQLYMNGDDPEAVTAVDVGSVVSAELFRLHPTTALQALDLLSNTTFWVSEGFDINDQPMALKKVTEWITAAQASALQLVASTDSHGPGPQGAAPAASALQAAGRRSPAAGGANATLAELLGGTRRGTAADLEVLRAMPAIAQRLAEESVKLHLLDRRRAHARRHAALFGSKGSQLLLANLLGGRAARPGAAPTLAEQAVSSGQPAKPETLLFAKYLAANATDRADAYQEMCFDYSSESSSALDSFATQIQGMVKQTQSFLNTMMQYATPAGIERLETQIQGFAASAVRDVSEVIERRMVSLLNESGPLVEHAVRHAAHEAGERLGHMIGGALATPAGQALQQPLGSIVGKVAGNGSSLGHTIGEKLGQSIGEGLGNLTGDFLGDKAAEVLEDLVISGLENAGDALNSRAGKLALTEVEKGSYGSDEAQLAALLSAGERAEAEAGDLPDALSGAWEAMANTLKELSHRIPTATGSLKFARREVSKLSSNLDSIFNVFDNKGPKIFDSVAGLWRTVWVIYFVVMMPLPLILLYYGCWAGGYFGGPQPLPEHEEAEPPATWRARCATCLWSCSLCMKRYHDTQLCFWSIIILMQVIVLLIFIVSVLLCVLAGIKTFLVAGCSQIYVINDDMICSEALQNIRAFLGTFLVSRALGPLEVACDQHTLLACRVISQKMASSTMLTTTFSLLGTLLSLQMLIQSAVLHEQALWRRRANTKLLEEAEADAAASSSASPP